jgi:hypothetical protein
MSTGFSILFKMSSLVSTGLKSQVELRLISFFNINIKKTENILYGLYVSS